MSNSVWVGGGRLLLTTPIGTTPNQSAMTSCCAAGKDKRPSTYGPGRGCTTQLAATIGT